MPHYVSSGGVMLRLVDQRSEVSRHDPHGRRRREARPIVPTPDAPQQRADYLVEFTIHIICRDKQDLMAFHWPRFLAARWPGGVDHVDLDTRTHAGKPNVIRVRQTLRHVREHEAVTYCLPFVQGLRFKLDRGAPFRFVGESRGRRTDGIFGFTMTRLGA